MKNLCFLIGKQALGPPSAKKFLEESEEQPDAEIVVNWSYFYLNEFAVSSNNTGVLTLPPRRRQCVESCKLRFVQCIYQQCNVRVSRI